MPRVTRIGSVEIRINSGDHHPAHVHVYCDHEDVVLLIADGSIYSGSASATTLAVARAYLAGNRDDLTDRFFAINHHLPR